MKNYPCLILLSLLISAPLVAADPPGGQVRGTMCTSNSLMVPGEKNTLIACKGMGPFNSVAEIYDRGFRVVSSGFLPDSRPGFPPLTHGFYMIIEERK